MNPMSTDGDYPYIDKLKLVDFQKSYFSASIAGFFELYMLRPTIT